MYSETSVNALEPRWAPLQGAAHYSGLSQRLIEIAVRDGLIRSALARRPGASRGRRLVDLRSLDAWIEQGLGEKCDLTALQAGAAKRLGSSTDS